jgi:flagellum-specific peptidoglycan hydrolase FlgJ
MNIKQFFLKKIIYFSIFNFLIISILVAQKRAPAYNYIEDYGLTAINTMHETKIPASIIMAVAMEESALGTSEVAKKSNNHFGMKAGENWKTAKYCTDGGSCYRSFATAKISYEEFGKLLSTNKKQYGFLFKFPKTDYKNWAKGLAKSGYCQGDKTYAARLIAIIEAHQLYNFDQCFWEFK